MSPPPIEVPLRPCFSGEGEGGSLLTNVFCLFRLIKDGFDGPSLLVGLYADSAEETGFD